MQWNPQLISAALCIAVTASAADAGAQEPLIALQDSVERLVSRVAPAVVSIHVELAPIAGAEEGRATRPRTQTGSGVLIREDGAILTSEHIVHAAVKISVTLSDGHREPAELVGADARADLAVIRVRASGLPVAELGDVAGVRRGHIVLALGNPMGLAADGQASLAMGVVSAIGRALPTDAGLEQDRYYGDLIQTSAPINPGNSGGPLVDIHGRVIGIVTAIMTRTGASEGIGFAVPMSQRTRDVIQRLLQGEPVAYGYLGIDMRAAQSDECRSAGIADGAGAVVQAVVTSGPADIGGIAAGDIITTFAATAILSPDHLLRLIGNTPPGQTIRVELVRQGVKRAVQVSVGRRRMNTMQRDPTDGSLAWRGALLEPLSEPMRRQSRAAAGALRVVSVQQGSAAARAGIEAGEIIVEIAGKPLLTERAGVDILSNAEGEVRLRSLNRKLRTVSP